MTVEILGPNSSTIFLCDRLIPKASWYEQFTWPMSSQCVVTDYKRSDDDFK